MRISAFARRATGVLLVSTLAAAPAAAQPGRDARVSVQPFEGELGPTLREQIARTLRAHGYRTLTSLARVGGTGQYLELARDNHLAAFVTGDLEEGRHHDTITFLLWDGATGSVQARWSVSAPAKKLPKAIAKGFWKTFGPKLEGLEPPPSDELDPAPPMYVNAGEPI